MRSGLSAIRCYVGTGWFVDLLHDWTSLFSNYPQGSSGWTGADGIYAANLDGIDYDFSRRPEDKKTFFIFSDTFTSTVNPVTGERPGGPSMPRNTRATLSGGFPRSVNMNFVTSAINMNPPVTAENYWLGDTFVVGDKVYIYTMIIHNYGGMWGFKQVGVDLARFTIRDGAVDESSLAVFKDTNKRLSDITGGLEDADPKWYLGGAVFENTAAAGALKPDGYIYVYGYYDYNSPSNRRMIVARVQPDELEDFTRYEYLWSDNTWKAQAWGANPDNPKFLTSYFCNVEFSVHEVKAGPDAGKFYHVYMAPVFTDDWVRLAVADGPASVFSGNKMIFRSVDPFNQIPPDGQTPNGGMYVYNAKAHPAISTEYELYITYNVNGGNTSKYADIYRPRFIRYAQVPLTAP